ncbi:MULTISPECIES: SDR family NAD(P)-dependent oxidoreductase [unclassified Rhodococcus (in: high G+C Gram-positive bacteria)]|uniref:SDR family NAD(P)-dependent oxidoreductase n=1 Tax=unclassified Rhodococcus (in: high G+C Gram-positive bacteria) TaxID=192944 RepID=UPI000B9C322B|nr:MULTISPECIES: glucose 1-dehydrogenase [unclassified Rhodococcus (in: high G+C Gram-positive bacteria)]OZD06537.1 short-chain dehydrogenase [Rhodococcus sp. 06-235-1A]OZF42014.1 short-chain dehydrogenase [Rhodococcus sp. 14-2470-1a]
MNSAVERFGLAGRVAIITGSSSGLGRGFARALSDAGAAVVLAARRQEQLADLAAEITVAGREVLIVTTDVSNKQACTALVAEAMDTFGRVDVLVNNAGIGTAVPALRETEEQFRAVIDVNLMGTYWMAQACARVMSPGSAIVNIASVLGLIKSYAPQAAYSASKAAVIGLTRDLSQQWSGRRGIRVNAIAPGYFESEMTASIPNELLTQFVAQTSTLGRLGLQHELDAAVLFLASNASSYITGITLPVDGGMSGH